MRITNALLLSLALLAAGPAPGTAQMNRDDHAALEALVVEMADTPREHQALARYYQQRAEQMRKMADDHRSMEKAYLASKLTQRQRMKAHCADLAASFDQTAEEYEAMAKEHEAAAGS